MLLKKICSAEKYSIAQTVLNNMSCKQFLPCSMQIWKKLSRCSESCFFFFLLPTTMVTLQQSYREQSLYCCHVQTNIRCLSPSKGHMYRYTLLMVKQTEINYANVACLWGFSWDGLQAVIGVRSPAWWDISPLLWCPFRLWCSLNIITTLKHEVMQLNLSI